MLTRQVKHVSIAVLIVTAILWSEAPRYGVGLRFVISLGAVMVAVQAMHSRKRGWMAGFFGIAVLYNPLLPIVPLFGTAALAVVLATIPAFALSIYRLPTKPLLSIPSITDRTPGSQSL